MFYYFIIIIIISFVSFGARPFFVRSPRSFHLLVSGVKFYACSQCQQNGGKFLGLLLVNFEVMFWLSFGWNCSWNMPSQENNSDSNDLASKYSHLLQPIRDLTKNWDIDVAAQLEEYLAEVRIWSESNAQARKKAKILTFSCITSLMTGKRKLPSFRSIRKQWFTIYNVADLI